MAGRALAGATRKTYRLHMCRGGTEARAQNGPYVCIFEWCKSSGCLCVPNQLQRLTCHRQQMPHGCRASECAMSF